MAKTAMSKRKATKKPVATAVTFASLVGIRAEGGDGNDEEETQDEKQARWAALAEENPDCEQAEDESDADYAARMEAMDEEEASAEDEGGGEGDDGDPEKKEKEEAVKDERQRCARIIAYGVKNNCVAQAAVLAFDVGLTASQAISTMKAAAFDGGGTHASNGGGLGSRMAGVKNHSLNDNPGSAAGNRNTPKGQATSILASLALARPEKSGVK